jgi:hypothetical protein
MRGLRADLPWLNPRVGIVRSSTSRLLAPFEASYPAVYQAIQAAGLEVTDPGNPIGADAKRSVRKNRWEAIAAALRSGKANQTGSAQLGSVAPRLWMLPVRSASSPSCATRGYSPTPNFRPRRQSY